MKWYAAFALVSLSFGAGCSKEEPDSSTYVLIRKAGGGTSPGLRAYFIGEGAHLNGISCRELLLLANEAVEARISRGETNLEKYECVSVPEARERGFK
jgi:hypothetical protein